MPDTTYTHGHDDSVLRSHRWRTAANSAAYLLPRLATGLELLDVGMRPGHHHRRPGPSGRPRPGGRHRRRDRGAGAGPRRPVPRGRSRPSPSRWPICSPCPSPTTRSTSSTPTRCSSTWPTPWPRWSRCGAVCRPGGVVAARDADYRTFTFAPAEPDIDRAIAAYGELTRRNRARWDAGRHLLGWPMPRGSPRSGRRRRCGASPLPTSGRGGAACGLTGSPLRAPSLAEPADPARGSPSRTSSRRSAPAGAGGRHRRTAGSPCSTARSWPTA